MIEKYMPIWINWNMFEKHMPCIGETKHGWETYAHLYCHTCLRSSCAHLNWVNKIETYIWQLILKHVWETYVCPPAFKICLRNICLLSCLSKKCPLGIHVHVGLKWPPPPIFAQYWKKGIYIVVLHTWDHNVGS